MHATSCGYADLASEAMTLLGLQHDRAELLTRALLEDALFGYPPRSTSSSLSCAGASSSTSITSLSSQSWPSPTNRELSKV